MSKKICTKIYEWLYVGPEGKVYCCPWNSIVIGDLLENTLEEIWKGEKLEEIRQEFMKGNLIGCNQHCCPECINGTCFVDNTEEEAKKLYDEIEELPPVLNISYDVRCNHRCPSCRPDYIKCDSAYLQKMKRITENIEPYLGKVKRFSANGQGDFFVCNEMVDMISRFRPQSDDFAMFLETNGVLFKENWHKIEWLKDYFLTVSVTPNSFEPETYKYLAGKDNLDKFLESMRFIKQLKDEGAVNRIRMIMVVQDTNFREIPSFVKRCIEEFDADDVVLRPIFKWFRMTDEEWYVKNIMNPAHPYHKEYIKIIEENEICKSSKVMNWGFLEKQPEVTFASIQRPYRKYYECVLKMILMDNFHDKLKQYLDLVGAKRISFYGIGSLWNVFVKLVNLSEFTIEHLYDLQPNCELGSIKPIYAHISVDNSDLMIVLAINAFEEIKHSILLDGYRGRVVSLEEILDCDI